MLTRTSLLAVTACLSACANPPGEVVVTNQYTGPCDITFVFDGDGTLPATEPLPADSESYHLGPGVVAARFDADGEVCGAACWFVNSMSFGSMTCGVYTAGEVAAEITVIDNGAPGCPQPQLVCDGVEQ